MLHLVGDLGLSYAQSSSVDARNWFSGYSNGSASFLVDVLTDGAAISTASGFSYATPVPEPGSWALLLTGVLALGHRVRRQRAMR